MGRVKILAGTGRGIMRSMVETTHFFAALTAGPHAALRRGPPPRAGEELL